MFTLPHIYVATKATGSHHPFLVLGSFLPDIGLLSQTEEEKKFSWKQLHEGGDQLWQYAQKSKRKFLSLALGVMTHGVTYGLDKYSDRSYRGGPGYALAKAKPLYKAVTACCKVNPAIGEIWAHNFIEMAVSLLVGQEFPQTLKDLETARKTNLKEISGFLVSCFGVEGKMVYRLLERLIATFTPENLSSARGLAESWSKIALNLEGVKIDKEKAAEVIEQGKELVKADHQKFLKESIKSMKENRSWEF